MEHLILPHDDDETPPDLELLPFDRLEGIEVKGSLDYEQTKIQHGIRIASDPRVFGEYGVAVRDDTGMMRMGSRIKKVQKWVDPATNGVIKVHGFCNPIVMTVHTKIQSLHLIHLPSNTEVMVTLVELELFSGMKMNLDWGINLT